MESLSHNDKQYVVVKDVQQEHILEYQLHMLLNNELHHVCIVEKVENNNQQTLYFDRTGLQSLESYYENKIITKKQYADLLLDIIDILLRGEHYLLPHHQYVLEPQYIFIDKDTQKPYLIFLPIKGERIIDYSFRVLINFLNRLPKSDDLLDLSYRVDEKISKDTTIKQLKFLIQGKYLRQQREISVAKKEEEEVDLDDRKKQIAMVILLGQVLIICLLIFAMNMGHLGSMDITKIMALMVIFGALDILIYQRYKKHLEKASNDTAIPVIESDKGLVVYKEKGEYYICFTESARVHK